MKVTCHGQPCLTVEPAGTRLLFDPFVRQYELAQNVGVDAIRADRIHVASERCDHVADAVDLARRTGAPVIANGLADHWLDHGDAEKPLAAAGRERVLLPVDPSCGF